MNATVVGCAILLVLFTLKIMGYLSPGEENDIEAG